MTTQRRGVTPVPREEALTNAVPPDLFRDSGEAPAAAHARFNPAALALALEVAGGAVLRYGLVAILVLFGAFKFTAVEAAGIEPLVRHTPLLSRLYSLTLLGAALWSAGEALRAIHRPKATATPA